MKPAVAVLGGGGHAKVVIAALQEMKHTIVAVFDDDATKYGKRILGALVAGPIAEHGSCGATHLVAAIGDNSHRRRIVQSIPDARWLCVVHPAAYVHHSAFVAHGAMIMAGARIQPDATVGAHTIINTGACIDHDCTIDEFAHIGPGAILAGGVTVGSASFLGAGVVVVPGIAIAANTIAGAGAVVIRNTGNSETVVGVPAKGIPKSRTKSQ